MNLKRITVAGIATLTLAMAAGSVMAQARGQAKSHKEIVAAMEAKKMTLANAITKAEEEAKGTAVGARAELQEGELHFTVQVSVGDDLKTARVDSKGKVTMTEGRRAREEGGEKPEGAKGGEPRNPRKAPKPVNP